MARTIAIELEVNGVKESVKTIGELETAIEQLTEELKNTDIGSEKFQKLTTELNTARSELKSFEKDFEGLEPAQKAQAYISFGESVVSGILLAQEALRAFGIENENVSNAVEASTQAINIALQSRILFEGALEAKVIATTIAQKALNTSVVQGNRALKVLFTTMAANPLGAVLAVVGLLVAAFVSLSDATDENTDATDENNKALERQNELRAIQANLIAQAEAEISEARSRGLSGLRDEVVILEERQRIINEEIKLLEDRARAVSVEINQAKIRGESVVDLQAQYDNLLKLLQNERQAGEANNKVLEALKNEIKAINREISQRELERFTKDLSSAADEVDRLNRNLLDFGEAPTPKIIEDLENLLSLQLQLQEVSEESRKTLSNVFTDYVEQQNTALSTIDNFGREYEVVRKQLTDVFEKGNVEDFNAELEKTRKQFLDSDVYTKEQKRAIAELLSGYKTAFDNIINLGVEGTEEFTTLITPLLEGLTQKLRLEGDINFKKAEDAADDFASSLTTALEPTFDTIGVIRREAEDNISQFILDTKTLERGTEEFYNARQSLIDKFQADFIAKADERKLNAEDEEKAREAALKTSEEIVDRIIDTIAYTAKAEDAIRGVYNEFEDLQGQIIENQNNIDIFFGLILSNFDKFKDEFNFKEVLDPTADLEKNYAAIVKFFEEIGADSVLTLFNTEEEKLEIVEFFLKKRQELIDEQADNEKKTQQELLQETFDNYAEIVSGLNQLTLSLGEASQLQIERVEANTEELLSNIVGDTKEAEELRTEIQEESNEKIVEIERRARLRELQFTKIQAIADLAQALINAQKLPPPFNAIQSAIIGAAGSIQITTIQGQIDDLQSAQGFSTGGYVEGPGSGTSDSIPAMLSNGEFVVNAKATQKFLPLLEEINESDIQFRRFNNGGYVLDSSFIPSTSTLQNNFDDSRIIEELRKTRQEPLRAYVFEKDITQAQQIEKRLQELSKL